ncbi:RNA ligase 1 isoform X4 [Hemitrygon akajei]|uniref:RNA ligase 1 isoform X4 n=1 Tax=Hemitrygon akajei TaxID=2704970 RepID=UPI003BFA323A
MAMVCHISGHDSIGNRPSSLRSDSGSFNCQDPALSSLGISTVTSGQFLMPGFQHMELPSQKADHSLMRMDTFLVREYVPRLEYCLQIWSLHYILCISGHLITRSWIPVEKGSKQYCWHLSAVNYETGSALVLRPSSGKQLLEITVIPLMELLEQTLELIGTHINGNPYGLGSKKQPLHLLVSHGSLQIENPPPLDLMDLVAWFKESEEAKVEGIVWHCANGVLVKLHRHHLGLEWPLLRPFLSTRPLSINVDLNKFTWDFEANSSFVALARLHGKQFDRVKDIAWEDIES